MQTKEVQRDARSRQSFEGDSHVGELADERKEHASIEPHRLDGLAGPHGRDARRLFEQADLPEVVPAPQYVQGHLVALFAPLHHPGCTGHDDVEGVRLSVLAHDDGGEAARDRLERVDDDRPDGARE